MTQSGYGGVEGIAKRCHFLSDHQRNNSENLFPAKVHFAYFRGHLCCIEMAPNPYPAVPFIWKTPGPTTDSGIVCQPYTFLIRKARFLMHLSRARVALGCYPTLSMSMKPVFNVKDNVFPLWGCLCFKR